MTESGRDQIFTLIAHAKERLDRLDTFLLNSDKVTKEAILLEWKCLNTYISVLGDKIKSL